MQISYPASYGEGQTNVQQPITVLRLLLIETRISSQRAKTKAHRNIRVGTGECKGMPVGEFLNKTGDDECQARRAKVCFQSHAYPTSHRDASVSVKRASHDN